MFQTFDNNPNPKQAAPRVAKLRSYFKAAKVDAFLIPRADEHQGEYVSAYAERLHWLTGFSGSAGQAVVAKSKAALVVDGRYTVQARAEVDQTLFSLPEFKKDALANWISTNLPANSVIGYDPWLHTTRQIDAITDKLSGQGIRIKPVSKNLVDRAWYPHQPSPPREPVFVHPLKYAGQKNSAKLARVQEVLTTEQQSATVLTLPDSIAWLFNIRGSDIVHNPVPLAFAIVPASGKARLFIAPEKLNAETKAHLKTCAILHKPNELRKSLLALKAAKKPVRIDQNHAAHWFIRVLGAKNVVHGSDSCIAMKANKNAAEIKGARAAHRRDGAAMVEFLYWLDREAGKGTVDEIAAVKKLEAFRAATGKLREISFDTISGSGPNGAIVHYRVSKTTNRKLQSGDLYLVDSGAQYQDGTTDITRTIAIGKVSREMQEHFTRVLKGHIAIATAVFPKGTRGVDLDPFARRALWQAGLDYGHGTGHGVGSYLSVHEGPQSISKAGMVALESGMICSNEPGYYKEGSHGIRIENLVLVNEAKVPPKGDAPMLSFETLTLAPIDRRLIVTSMLSKEERDWLNYYHQRVEEALKGEVAGPVARWLKSATKPV